MLRGITNARVVMSEEVLEGATLTFEEGRISGILRRRVPAAGGVLDAGDGYVLPGLVDLHSDAIEQQLAPRPGVEFAPEVAFLETDRLFAGAGVTTGLHAISFMRDSKRSLDLARRLCEGVDRFRQQGLVRHGLHVRCELPEDGTVEAVEEVLYSCDVGIASIMDHTPGQGQFRDLEWFRRYWTEDVGLNESEVDAAVEQAKLGGGGIAADRLERLCLASKRAGAVLASHDDDTPERVELLDEAGVEISEFPVNAEAAHRARELGLSVCMGAPNVVRGGSSGGNLRAVEAVKLGLVDALCSDYHPPSMLVAAFKLAEDGEISLPKAVRLVSSGPARAAGMKDRGEIREGVFADLTVVRRRLGLPTASHTLVDGFPISVAEYGRAQPNDRELAPENS